MQKSENRSRKPAKSFQDLIVWQKSHAFVLSIYGLTKDRALLESAEEVSKLLTGYAQSILTSIS